MISFSQLIEASGEIIIFISRKGDILLHLNLIEHLIDHWTLRKNIFSGGMNHTSQSGSVMVNLSLVDARRTLPTGIHNAKQLSLVEEG